LAGGVSAVHAAEGGRPLAMEAAADAQADQLLEVGRDLAAHLVGRLVGHRLDIDDGELVVEREADRHVVHEIAGLQRAAPFAGMLVGLLVGDVALDVPQPVFAEIALAGDATRMQELSPDRRRKRHDGTSFSSVALFRWRLLWRPAARCATRRCACPRASEYQSEIRKMRRSGRLRGCGAPRAAPGRRW